MADAAQAAGAAIGVWDQTKQIASTAGEYIVYGVSTGVEYTVYALQVAGRYTLIALEAIKDGIVIGAQYTWYGLQAAWNGLAYVAMKVWEVVYPVLATIGEVIKDAA